MPDKDTLTLTLRLHDPLEKKDRGLSTAWVVLAVERADLELSEADFIAKYIAPNLHKLQLMPTEPKK